MLSDKFKFTAAAVAIAAIAGSSLVQAHDGPAHDRDDNRRLIDVATIDVNGDETVSRDEFVLVQTERFEKLDRNGDGYLTFAELRAHRMDNAQRPRRAENRARFDKAGRSMRRGGNPVQLADTDGDNQLSRAEFAALGDRLFKKLDKNADGVLNTQDR